jgi:hypothetical protein
MQREWCGVRLKSVFVAVGVVELSRVKGLGPAKVEALQAAGITSAEELASVDLRRGVDAEGITPAALKAYKQRARQVLHSEGVPFEKAPYGTKAGAPARVGNPDTKKTAPARTAKPAAKRNAPAPSAPPKRGWLRRLVGKA